MFSIADIQTEEENDYENSEEGEGAEEEGMAYPIRVSVSVTKVRYIACIDFACGADG